MSCKDAMIPSVITFSPEQTVGEALETLQQYEIRTAPVVNAKGMLVGMFGLHTLMQGLLPVAAQIEGGLEGLDFVVDGTPGAAKRIRKLAPRKVGDFMDENVVVLHPDSSMMEAILLLAKNESPIAIVEEDSQKFVGLVSEQSCLDLLYRTLAEVTKDEAQRSHGRASG